MDQAPILTITLNPALDAAADVPELVPNVKLRCGPPQFHPGGGGINVSRAIAKLGGHSRALVVTGGATGEHLQHLIAAEGIALEAIDTGGETRQSFSARDVSSGDLYRFMLPGTQWTQNSEQLLSDVLQNHLEPNAYVVISGSMPPGGDAGVIQRIQEKTLAAGATLVADTSGDVLAALCARTGTPLHTLRMDMEEALASSGIALQSPAEFADYGGSLVGRGVADHVVIGMGPRGSVGVSADERIFCSRPIEKPLSAVGAGDSFVGAMTLAHARKEPFESALALGTAAAASAVVTPGTELCNADQTAAFLKDVETVRL